MLSFRQSKIVVCRSRKLKYGTIIVMATLGQLSHLFCILVLSSVTCSYEVEKLLSASQFVAAQTARHVVTPIKYLFFEVASISSTELG